MDPDLSWTGGDPWLASDGPTLIYTVVGYRGGSPDALALTESIGNQEFSPWRIIARAPDVAADAPGGAGIATFDKPSVDLGTVPFGSGAIQIAAVASRLKRKLGPSNVQFDIALSKAFSLFSDQGAADQSWTTRLLDVGSPISMVTNPIVKISHEGTGNLFVAYQRQGFDQNKPYLDTGDRAWRIVRTTVSDASTSLVFSRFTTTNTIWSWKSGDATRTILDVVPMSFDITRRPTGTHLWITYAEKADAGEQDVVVADCDDTEAHRCTPETGWRYKTFKGLHSGDLLQPSVVADRNNQGVSVTFYENRGEGVGLEPEGVLGGLDPDGDAKWAGVVSLALADPFTNPRESTYLPCPYDNNRYGDYIGSVRLPIPSLTVSAWADSRGGCVSPGNDLHVQATVW